MAETEEQRQARKARDRQEEREAIERWGSSNYCIKRFWGDRTGAMHLLDERSGVEPHEHVATRTLCGLALERDMELGHIGSVGFPGYVGSPVSKLRSQAQRTYAANGPFHACPECDRLAIERLGLTKERWPGFFEVPRW
jgi:hypothetical protein